MHKARARPYIGRRWTAAPQFPIRGSVATPRSQAPLPSSAISASARAAGPALHLVCRAQDVAVVAAVAVPTTRPEDWEQEIEESLKLVALLPPSVASVLENHPQLFELLEVVMDLGRPPIARFSSGDVKLNDEAVSAEDLQYAVAQVGEFGGDNRAGIDRTLHRISCMRNRTGRIIGLTCRVGRAIKGSALLVRDLVLSGASILFLGRPGVGKTTAIREVSRMLAEELAKRVVIVDTSNEIGGDGDIPHEGIGRARRMQVANPEEQHKVMIEGVENHMPEVIVIDEIGTELECLAARTIAQRGVQLVATAHGNELENVIKNPALADLVGGIQSVTLGDEEAKRRGVQKSILERAGPPTFDVAVEMLERSKWRVHVDVAHAVDVILAGGSAGGQVRERTADGSIKKYNYDPMISGVIKQGPARMGLPKSLEQQQEQQQQQQSQGQGQPGPGEEGAQEEEFTLQRPSYPYGSGAAAAAAAASSGSGGARSSSGLRSSFSKASLYGEEAGEEGQQRKPRKSADPASAHLRLYCHELDQARLWDVLDGLRLLDKVHVASKVDQADAVLAVRSKLRSNAVLRQAARDRGIPIYAIKNSNTSSLVRAFRTLMGIDPAAGGAFARAGAEDALGSDPAYNADFTVAAFRAESDIALLKRRQQQQQQQQTFYSDGSSSSSSKAGGQSSYQAQNHSEALEEVRVAAETLVLPLGQQVELLPRSEEVMSAQQAQLRAYGLGYEVVGSGGGARLRILPSKSASAAADADAPHEADGGSAEADQGAVHAEGRLERVSAAS